MLQQLPELREMLMFTRILKDMIKDSDNSHMKRSIGHGLAKVSSVGAPVPMELGCVTLSVWMSTPTQKLSEPFWDFHRDFIIQKFISY